MAVLSDYTSGTITLANGSTAVTGTGTLFDVAKFREGDTLQIQNLTAVIASVNNNTSLTLTAPWSGTSLADAPYRARYLPDGARVTAQATTLIELLGNGVLSNLAELGVEDGKVPVGNAAGEYELKDQSTFGIQDPNGSLGKLAALTLAANKAVTTDGSGNAQQIDLGTLGRALLALTTGTSAQYVQGDGTLKAKSEFPISDAIQTALEAKFDVAGGNVSGDISIRKNEPRIGLVSPGAVYGTTIEASVSDVSNFGLRFLDSGTEKLRVGGSGAPAIQVFGNASISGTLSKGGGTFLIDHPLDPLNLNLRHGFVEAPRYDLVYRGTVQLENGRASVDIDAASNMTSGTFAALTTNAVVTNLQNQDGFTRLKPGAINGGSFEIICDDENCTDLVSWVVIAERNDPFVKSDLDPNTDNEGRFVPEFEKEDT